MQGLCRRLLWFLWLGTWCCVYDLAQHSHRLLQIVCRVIAIQQYLLWLPLLASLLDLIKFLDVVVHDIACIALGWLCYTAAVLARHQMHLA